MANRKQPKLGTNGQNQMRRPIFHMEHVPVVWTTPVYVLHVLYIWMFVRVPWAVSRSKFSHEETAMDRE